MKKVLALLLTTVIAVCCFAGCFKDDNAVGKKPASESDIFDVVQQYFDLVYAGDSAAQKYVDKKSSAFEKTNNALGNKEKLTQFLKGYFKAPDKASEKIDFHIEQAVESCYANNYFTSPDDVKLHDDKKASVYVTVFSPDTKAIESALDSVKTPDLIKESPEVQKKLADAGADTDEITTELIEMLFNKTFNGEKNFSYEESVEVLLENRENGWVIVDIVKNAKAN